MRTIESKGYFSEIFSSFQGEGGTVRGSCFGKRQIFIRFSGCNLFDGDFDSTGCFWCDSTFSQRIELKFLKVEKIPGSLEFIHVKNPLKIYKILEIIKGLITKDLHSISFTGGEPLLQLDVLFHLASTLRTQNVNYPLYLETNGSIELNEIQMVKLGDLFEYCCCDIKDRSARAATLGKWRELVFRELKFIETLVKLDVKTFGKLVVTSKTNIQDVSWICENLSKIAFKDGHIVGLAIQPVTLEDEMLKRDYSVPNSYLNEIFYTAAEYLPSKSLTLSIQAHKYLNLP
ncbi:MAG: hypothetical protein ACFFG0_33410 [Candidatus Thorarchaeota archaeon]